MINYLRLMLRYHELQPDTRLAPFVEAYWVMMGNTGPETITSNILPDCCCDILINAGDCLVSSPGEVIEKQKAYIIGAATEYSQVSVSGSVAVAGIRFSPAGLMALPGKLQLNEIKDTAVTLDHFCQLNTNFIFDGNETSPGLVKQKMDTFLLQFYNPDIYHQHSVRVVRAAMDIVQQQKGSITVNNLSHNVNTSPRNLERLFNKYVGLSPKEFAKITRLKNIRKELRTANYKSLEEIAFNYNYYDSAHFTRDFTRYAGVPPSRY